MYNGAVEAATSLAGALLALAPGFVKVQYLTCYLTHIYLHMTTGVWKLKRVSIPYRLKYCTVQQYPNILYYIILTIVL